MGDTVTREQHINILPGEEVATTQPYVAQMSPARQVAYVLRGEAGCHCHFLHRPGDPSDQLQGIKALCWGSLVYHLSRSTGLLLAQVAIAAHSPARSARRPGCPHGELELHAGGAAPRERLVEQAADAGVEPVALHVCTENDL